VVEFSISEGPVRRRNEEFRESNRKHAINGLLYGNLRGLTMNRGERVRWYVIGSGNENDLQHRALARQHALARGPGWTRSTSSRDQRRS